MRYPSRISFSLALLILVAVAACDNNPTTPSPPVTAAPILSCPADIQAGLLQGPAVPVQYTVPVAVGGSSPVSVSCAQPSGSDFPLGTTSVVCTATDATARTAQCTFRVMVERIPQLRGTKIVAFGDSITAGEVSLPVDMATPYLDVANSYPSVLERELDARYSSQDVVVINEGIPGEQVLGTGSSSNGEGRIERLAIEHRPDVMLVLEGVNGLSLSNAEDISEGLRRGVRRAKRQGVPLVIVSTILPGVEGRVKPPDPAAVLELNEEIRFWASAEGAVLVDSYALFEPDKAVLIGRDGLHPTLEGYAKLAEGFRNAIQAHFELPPDDGPPATSGFLFARPGRR